MHLLDVCLARARTVKNSFLIKFNRSAKVISTFALACANFAFGSEAPTAIEIDNANFPENSKKGVTVGYLSAADVDPDEKHTFKLVSDAADNSLFTLSGNRLRTNAVGFDFEDRSEYTVQVEVTDRDDLSYVGSISVGVTDVNEAPTGVLPYRSNVSENSPKDSLVSYVLVQDVDANYPDKLSIKGFTINGSKDALLDFSNNGGLLQETSNGEMLLDDGPGNKGIDFLNESEIRNFGHGVTRNDYHQTLIEGYLFTESANYEFRIGQRDDRTVFWMDLDRDNVFERDGDMGDERLIWGTSTRSMALDEGPYRFAFGHMEHGGQSKFNLLYVLNPTQF